jgi:hypothetical protein
VFQLSRRDLARVLAASLANRLLPSDAAILEGFVMHHIVLLGDSVLDNAAYVGGGPDVVRQLRERLPQGWNASLLAVDGSVTTDIAVQMRRLPTDASHLVVSVGGNDALRRSGLLADPVRTVAEGLGRLSDVRETFETDYGAMLDEVVGRGVPTAVCTIYDLRFFDLLQRRSGVVALAVFNDVITRAAFSRGTQLIDLRLVCNEDGDFANPIEPSVQGGGKIAAAVVGFALSDAPQGHRSEVFVR